MLPPWMIEKIREEQERQKDNRLPLYIEVDYPREPPPKEDKVTEVIIKM